MNILSDATVAARSGSGRGDLVLVIILTALSGGLLLWQTGEKSARYSRDASRIAVGRVTGVDNDLVQLFGVVSQGDQKVDVEVLDGKHAGQAFTGFNTLLGDPELDWLFSPGQEALIAINDGGERLTIDILGPYRLRKEGALAALFFFLLVGVAGWIGIKAVLSFVFAVLLIWRALIPLCLAGYDPILCSLLILGILTGSITFLVGGLTRKGLTAFLGGFLGLLVTCALAIVFAPSFHLIGTTRPLAKALLFATPQLDIYRFFVSGIFIASSGAVMDLSMDIAAAMEEIVAHNPSVSRGQLLVSGLKVGRAVLGTMTTTLLLAYSGGYLMMLTYFMAQGISASVMMNSTYFASEALNVIVGSFGLTTVAPFSAIVGSLIFTRKTGTQSRTQTAVGVPKPNRDDLYSKTDALVG